jgi:hypothetical protein
MGRCLYARDPRGETSACVVVLVLVLVAAFVENLVCADKCSLRVELPRETIEPESCVIVAGDSEGEEQLSLVLKRASDAYGDYRVGLTQAIVARTAETLVSPACKDPVNHALIIRIFTNHVVNNHARRNPHTIQIVFLIYFIQFCIYQQR